MWLDKPIAGQKGLKLPHNNMNVVARGQKSRRRAPHLDLFLVHLAEAEDCFVDEVILRGCLDHGNTALPQHADGGDDVHLRVEVAR